MDFELQPHLRNELVVLRPLRPEDFEALYAVASDPLIWEQHPNKNRYQRNIFETFFEGAIESNGALLVLDGKSGEVIGSSRYCELDASNKAISIGYTFLARHCWGSTYNPVMKKLMLDHAFKFVENVFFQIGANNIRSQTAIKRLGAIKIGEMEKAYYGEQKNLNFVYQININSWFANRSA